MENICKGCKNQTDPQEISKNWGFYDRCYKKATHTSDEELVKKIQKDKEKFYKK